MRLDHLGSPPNPFNVHTVADGPAGVVVVSGEVDLATAGKLRGAVHAVLDAGAHLEIDLRDTSFMDARIGKAKNE